MVESQQESWGEYYQRVFAGGSPWLDYSNAHVQGQTFGVAIESAGPINGKQCLDVGCGRGHLSLALAGLQASRVVGVDIVAESIAACRDQHPQVQWEVGTLEDEQFVQSLGQFDVIFLIEMLHYVDWRKCLHLLWKQLNAGGRIVVIVPNKDNAIVQKTIARFEGRYAPPNPAEIAALVAELPDLDCWGYRGMDFQQDQRLVPYVTSPWANTVVKEFSSNRMVVVLQKQAGVAVSAKP